MQIFIIGGAVLVLCVLCLFIRRASTRKAPQAVQYTYYRDLRYGTHERHVLDVSIPYAHSFDGVILFIHGGIWMYGNKSDYPVFLDVFRDKFITVSMSHRYIDENTHIADLEEDVSAAVAFIQRFCQERKADAKNLIIMGHSSGAHLSMMYAYKRSETSPIPIAFCVDMAGPSDLSDIAFLYNFKKLRWLKLFYKVAEKATGYRPEEGDITAEGYSETGQKLMSAISPLSFITKQTPPTIIVHDVTDSLVPYSNSAALHSVLNVYGVDHSLIALYSGIGHFLGAKKIKGGGLHYNKAMAVRLVKVMHEYMEKYCK
ncbi:MAG: alpha/beta hydrolase [Treponema sp.]|jgi:acetyl esterase/lipase|nr:alpha/beta hydrolase [Treponema sp.]